MCIRDRYQVTPSATAPRASAPPTKPQPDRLRRRPRYARYATEYSPGRSDEHPTRRTNQSHSREFAHICQIVQSCRCRTLTHLLTRALVRVHARARVWSMSRHRRCGRAECVGRCDGPVISHSDKHSDYKVVTSSVTPRDFLMANRLPPLPARAVAPAAGSTVRPASLGGPALQ